MRRIFTDERFPCVELINEGDAHIEVQVAGRRIDDFAVGTDLPEGKLSEAAAARRAQDYFERRAKNLTEFLPKFRKVPEAEVDAKDHTDVFNNPRDVSTTIDRLISQERKETDPERKEKLRAQIMRLMSREESLAESVVAHLIET